MRGKNPCSVQNSMESLEASHARLTMKWCSVLRDHIVSSQVEHASVVTHARHIPSKESGEIPRYLHAVRFPQTGGLHRFQKVLEHAPMFPGGIYEKLFHSREDTINEEFNRRIFFFDPRNSDLSKISAERHFVRDMSPMTLYDLRDGPHRSADDDLDVCLSGLPLFSSGNFTSPDPDMALPP